MNDKPRSVIDMRALSGKKKNVSTLKCEVLINVINPHFSNNCKQKEEPAVLLAPTYYYACIVCR